MSDRTRPRHTGAEDSRKRSLSPDERERSGRKKRSRHEYDEDDRLHRDRRAEHARSRPRSAERVSLEESGPDLSTGRWSEPELIAEDSMTYGTDFGGRVGPAGRGLAGRGHVIAQGRTGRGFLGARGQPEGHFLGGRVLGRMASRGSDEFSGRGDFSGRSRGRGFFRAFADRGRGRMGGRWVGRGRFGPDYTGAPMFGGRGGRGSGGRFEGPGFSGLGPSGLRAGRGLGPGGDSDGHDGPLGVDHFPGTPRQPAIDPAVLERRKKNIAARLKRQVHGLQMLADFIDESVHERASEILGDRGSGSVGHETEVQRPGNPSSMYMYKVLGADDKERQPICQQRFDQTQAFEYCLQLYQAVPEVRMSKYGHFVLPATAG